MADFPVLDGAVWGDQVDLTSVGAIAAINTKGAWATLVASTTRDSAGLLLAQRTADIVRTQLTDFGIGAAGAEVVIIPDWSAATSQIGGDQVEPVAFFPLAIPAGTRIAARSAVSATPATAPLVSCAVLGGGFPISRWSRVTTYGTDSANSRGTLTSVAVAVSWVQLTASTTNPIRWAILNITANAGTNLAAVAIDFAFAVGAAGSEVSLIALPQLIGRSAGLPGLYPQSIGPLPFNVPAGTRLAFRATGSAAMDVCVSVLGGD